MLSLVASVALALELCLKPRLLCLVKLAGDLWLATLTVNTVVQGVQMQVDVAVWMFAQTATMKTTQRPAA